MLPSALPVTEPVVVRPQAPAAALPAQRPGWQVPLLFLGLPAALLLVFYAFVGFYYETCDDLSLVLLLTGQYNGQPSSHLYLHLPGLSNVLALLYAWQPKVAWYGWTLALAAWGGLSLLTQVLYLQTRGRVGLTAALTGLLFVLGYCDSLLFTNFTRIPILIAGTYVVAIGRWPEFYARHWGWWLLGVGLLLLAGTIRFAGAGLGAALAAPAVVLYLNNWRTRVGRAEVLRLVVLPLLLLGAVLALRRLPSPAVYDGYKRIYTILVQIKDYESLCLRPRTRADSLVVEAAQTWMVGDEAFFNPITLARIGQPQTLAEQLAAFRLKLKLYLPINVKNYFPALLIIGLCAAYILRRVRSRRAWLEVGLVNAAFAGVALAFLYWMKLPPRVASPMITLLLLLNVLLVFRHVSTWPELLRGRSGRLLLLMALILSGLALGRVWLHKGRLLRKRAYNEQSLAFVNQHFAGRTLVRHGLFDQFLVALDPLRPVPLSRAVRLLPVAGWFTLDPSMPRLYAALSGRQRTWLGAVDAAAHDPRAVWMLPAGFDRLLRDYLATLHGVRVRFEPLDFPDEPHFVDEPRRPPGQAMYFRAVPEGPTSSAGMR